MTCSIRRSSWTAVSLCGRAHCHTDEQRNSLLQRAFAAPQAPQGGNSTTQAVPHTLCVRMLTKYCCRACLNHKPQSFNPEPMAAGGAGGTAPGGGRGALPGRPHARRTHRGCLWARPGPYCWWCMVGFQGYSPMPTHGPTLNVF